MATIVTFLSGTRMKQLQRCFSRSNKNRLNAAKDAIVSVRDHEQLATILYIFYIFLSVNSFSSSGLKPWLNGVASRRKLKTWVYLRLLLARACAYLR